MCGRHSNSVKWSVKRPEFRRILCMSHTHFLNLRFLFWLMSRGWDSECFMQGNLEAKADPGQLWHRHGGCETGIGITHMFRRIDSDVWNYQYAFSQLISVPNVFRQSLNNQLPSSSNVWFLLSLKQTFRDKQTPTRWKLTSTRLMSGYEMNWSPWHWLALVQPRIARQGLVDVEGCRFVGVLLNIRAASKLPFCWWILSPDFLRCHLKFLKVIFWLEETPRSSFLRMLWWRLCRGRR